SQSKSSSASASALAFAAIAAGSSTTTSSTAAARAAASSSSRVIPVPEPLPSGSRASEPSVPADGAASGAGWPARPLAFRVDADLAGAEPPPRVACGAEPSPAGACPWPVGVDFSARAGSWVFEGELLPWSDLAALARAVLAWPDLAGLALPSPVLAWPVFAWPDLAWLDLLCPADLAGRLVRAVVALDAGVADRAAAVRRGPGVASTTTVTPASASARNTFLA